MGFDNECILNIQSLAGEYFCPVCRLLVYPNEALQSQCTHLYCKPCLTYIVSTTRACPYDGYLVTETDSKPLIESNKPLADTIGKIAVHCLYHRSGCTWQGPLNDCTSHCSGCSFGDSPVVCNRCGIQIVHRQVQEHAQNCLGVQHQVQKTEGATDPSTASAGATANHDQAVSQAAVVTSQLQTSQSTITTMPSQDPNLQTNSSSQSQSLVQGAGLTAEQWYQQQQQYQQYSQQYPGYDPYQQHYPQYYPYQQAVIPQYQQPNLQAHVPPTTGQHQVYVQPQTQSQLQPQQQVQPQSQIQSQLQPQQQAQPQLQPHNPHIQNPVDTQLPSPVQINPHQQLHPAVLPHSQIQSHAHPSAHGHPYPQPYSHSQVVSQPLTQEAQVPRYQQSHLQIQHPQPQIHQQIQPLIQPQPQHPAQSQSLSQAQPQGHLQYPPLLNPPQSNQAINVNVQVQAQNPPVHAVGGHQSYSQPQPQGKTGTLQQFPAHLQPQAMHLTQSSNPVQVQAQFLQQSMYPPSQAAIPSQQHPALLPSSGPIQNTASTQQPIHPHSQQPGHSVNQRPFIQPVQQAMPQQYYQQPLPISSQPPLQGQSHSFMQHIYAHPQPLQNVTQLPGLPNGQSQNVVGRHLMPNHGIHSQSYTQPVVGVQVRPRYHGANQQNILTPNDQGKLHPEQRFGDNIFHKSSAQQEPVVPSEKDAKVIGVVVDGSEIKSVKSETDMKSMDDEHKSMVEDKSKKAESHLFDNGGPKLKPIVKKDQDLENSTVQAGVTGGFQQKCLPLQEAELEEQVGELQKGAINISGVGPQAAHASSLSPGNVASSGSLFGAEGKSSHQRGFQDPMSDQGRQQQLSSQYGPTTLPQWPGAPSLLPTPLDPHQVHGLGYPPSHLRPPGVPVPGQSLHPPEHARPPSGVPDSGSVASFGRPYSQGNAGKPSFGTPPQGAFGSHGGMMPKATPYGYEGQKSSQHPMNLLNAETFSNQRLNYADSRQPYPNMTSVNVAPGFESVSTLESRDERFKPLPDEHPFRQGLDHRFPGRGQFENDVKQFLGPPSLDYHVSDPSSKPFGKGHHGSNYNAHERPDCPREDTDRMKPIHGHPDFFGPGPTFARHDMDGLAQRSPSRAHPGIPSGGFGGSSLDAISGRDIRRFGGPLGNSFREGRISMLPTHLHRGEFEGHGGMPLDEHFRNDVIGQDDLPGNLQRGEHLGPPNMPWNLHFDDPVSFGAHPRHVGRAEMVGPRMFEPFGRGNESSHPRFGEPGFRSNFSFHGFPSDDESYTADMEFGNLRKRKAMSNGWCRICKVDCDTIEGLDLHSQTREHQKRAMDMVRSIKRNAKKHKLTSGDLPSPGDANKLKNTISEGRGKKN